MDAYERSYGERNITSSQDAFAKVPLIFRAIRLRCNTLTRVPFYIYENEKLIDKYMFEDDLPMRDLLWKVEASLLLTGAGYVLKNRNQYGYDKGLQWLNPYSITMKVEGDEPYFQQYSFTDGRKYPTDKDYWSLDEMLYFREFHPLDDIGPGISATKVALGDASTLYNVTRFLNDFFSGDGLPVSMIIMPQDTEKSEKEAVENWFKKKLSKFRKTSTSRVLGVSADVKLEKLTEKLADFDFPSVDTHSMQSVADAFDVPQSLLRSDAGANRAISDNERESFIQDTVVPRTLYYEPILNAYLKEFNQRIEFCPEEMSEMQVDETDRASSLKSLIDSGVPLLAALDILGYDLSDEAQKIINDSLAKKEERANAFISNIQNPSSGSSGSMPLPSEENTSIPMRVELDRWMRKSLSNFKANKVANVVFETKVVPIDVQIQINKALQKAKIEGDIVKIFKGDNDAVGNSEERNQRLLCA